MTQAHLAAWQAAFAYLEREACVVRKGKDGVHRESGSGFVGGAYQHRTSRSQDPHLHTHVIVANLAKTPSDGRWRALDGEALLRTYRLPAGYLYQAQLRYELTRSLGVDWRDVERGMAEIAGIPEEVLCAFSTRREQVVDYLKRRGTAGFYAAKVAALRTRDPKRRPTCPGSRRSGKRGRPSTALTGAASPPSSATASTMTSVSVSFARSRRGCWRRAD